MRIAEIYSSLQGEGLLTGTPSVFIRASGCNLRCWFCDTPFTSWQPEGEDLSVAEIMRRALASAVAWASAHAKDNEIPNSRGLKPTLHGMHSILYTEARHAVLTGGEPMLFAEAIPLTQRLRESGFHITIETAGTLNLPVECDLMSISPKLSNSTPPAERDERGSA